MKLFSKMIRAIERNSRQNERRKLVDELEDIFITRNYNDMRAKEIMDRLGSLRRDDSCAYLSRNEPVKSVAQMVEEDDAALPEGLTGEWKAPT